MGMTPEEVFKRFCGSMGMDEDDVRATTWHRAGMIDFAEFILEESKEEFLKEICKEIEKKKILSAYIGYNGHLDYDIEHNKVIDSILELINNKIDGKNDLV